MEAIVKIFISGTICLLLVVSLSSVTAAQGKSNNKKEKSEITKSDKQAKKTDHEKERLNEEIEKTISDEKFLEDERKKMKESDSPRSNGQKHRFPHENKHVISGYGQIRSEEAQKKILLADTNMEHAQAAILRAEEKISKAKEKLLAAQKNKELSKEEITEKNNKIKKAEELLEEAKQQLKADLRIINEKFSVQEIN